MYVLLTSCVDILLEVGNVINVSLEWTCNPLTVFVSYCTLAVCLVFQLVFDNFLPENLLQESLTL